MKVAIATTLVPFVEAGGTFIADWLERELVARGHEVETLRFPFSDHPTELLEQMMGLRLLDVSDWGERLITIRTPSHLIRHPNKVCWFIHHYRGAYDLWGTKYQEIPLTPEGESLRAAIMSADRAGLAELRALFCNSKVVQRRLKDYNGLDAEVLYPPLVDGDQFGCDSYGDFFFYCSRLTYHKRQWLALEAMRFTRSAVRLVIAGAPDPGCEPYVAELEALIARLGIGDRVVLKPGWLDETEKRELFSRCLAAVYFPHDEDSYGYPSLEAHASSKAVVTTSDAGGTIELITDGVNGFVAPPDPEMIGRRMDRLYEDRELAAKMGAAGQARVRELGIDWDHVVRRLLS